MKIIFFYIRMVEKFIDKFGSAVSWIATLMVVVVGFDVTSRYIFHQSWVAVQELEWHLFGFLFLLAAAYTLKEDRHVRVDVIYAKLSERKKAFIDIAGIILFLIPMSLIIMFQSYDFVMDSFHSLEGSPNPGGLPYRFILKSAIPIGFFLVLIEGIAIFFKKIFILFGKENLLKKNKIA